LRAWLAEAAAAAGNANPDAMVLATQSAAGPSARVVLCKHLDAERGAVDFFTHDQSRKGRELAADPRAAAVFHWDALGRQVRLAGLVAQLPDGESDAYFATRPRAAQLGAWASRQSEPLSSRQELLDRVAEAERRFDAHAPAAAVPRPPGWGGYRLWLDAVELWVAGEARLHDRALWRRDLRLDAAGTQSFGVWSATRLFP
jgi:pyridoxamine 5'-phosphate oxidase